MISFELDDEVKELQETARKFAENEIRPKARDAEVEGKAPEELMKKYFDLGVSMIDYPEEVGGMACPVFWNAVMQEEIGYGDAPMASTLGGPGHAGGAVLAFGNDEQKQRLLAPFAEEGAHSKRGAIALMEEDKGQEFYEMSVTAKKKGDGWELNGKKSFVLGGSDPDLLIVFARAEDGEKWDGVKAFAVEKGTSGLVAGDRKRTMGYNVLDIADITLDECTVPAANMLDGEPDTAKGLIKMLDRIKVVEAARLVGMSRAATDYAVNYSQERQAFGKPIGHFQALAFLMSDMTIKANAARWAVWRAAAAIDEELENAHQIVAQAMAQVNDTALFNTNNAVQILGGHGFIQDHPVEKWMRDARTATILFGPMNLQYPIITRGEFTAEQSA